MSGKVKIFIDGSEGTTGLRIHERFAEREDVELLPISSELRKDKEERKRLINSSDITFLCLPDAAAEESVSLVENDHVRIIDTSTAHRTMEGWAYGFPELSKEDVYKRQGMMLSSFNSSSGTREAIAFAAASFISSVIFAARPSRAPLKIPGKATTLLT